ncbi:hypothetical protein ACIQTZ_15560 [Paenarthrobacter sp. NPDC090520]|uniref:hypothetical protein n=1 Tax=Paenarthrobacter sp. NPDC090520 TaxID=3364382 RepID=UPI00380333B8
MNEQQRPEDPTSPAPQGTTQGNQGTPRENTGPKQETAQPGPGEANPGSSWAWGEADSQKGRRDLPGGAPTQETRQAATQPGGTQPSAGWGAPPSGPTAANSEWGAPPSGPTAANSGWGAPPSGPTAANSGWGAPPSNTNGWGAPPANGWGSSLPGKDKGTLQGRWTLKRTLIVAGVAVVVAAGTAAGFYSLGNAGSADAANVPLGQAGGTGAQQGVPGQGLGPGGTGQDGSGTGQNGMGMPGQMGGMSPDGLGMAGGLNAAIHSEYVVLRDNEYVTMADQLGTVSEVSSNSLTVKSSDGFSRTYVLSSDTAVAQGTRQRGSTTSSLTIADIKSGATVRVTATKDGDTYAASSVRLTTATTSSGQGSTSGSGTTS